MAAVAARSHVALGTRMFDDRSTVRARGIGRPTRGRCGGDPCDRGDGERAERRGPLCAHRCALTRLPMFVDLWQDLRSRNHEGGMSSCGASGDHPRDIDSRNTNREWIGAPVDRECARLVASAAVTAVPIRTTVARIVAGAPACTGAGATAGASSKHRGRVAEGTAVRGVAGRSGI